MSSKKAAKVFNESQRWGFGAVAKLGVITAALSDVAPFLLAAGALTPDSPKEFIAALALGRAIRALQSWLGWGESTASIFTFFPPITNLDCLRRSGWR